MIFTAGHGKRRLRNINWNDPEKEGRRLDGIIKQLNTKFYNTDDDKLRLAYADGIIRATRAKLKLINGILGTK